MPWLAWMQQMFQYHGVVFEYGWLPADLIKLIAPLEPDGTVTIGGNVVPFKRG